jgi:hypothetical protein
MRKILGRRPALPEGALTWTLGGNSRSTIGRWERRALRDGGCIRSDARVRSDRSHASPEAQFQPFIVSVEKNPCQLAT